MQGRSERGHTASVTGIPTKPANPQCGQWSLVVPWSYLGNGGHRGGHVDGEPKAKKHREWREELAGCDWPLLTRGGRPTSSEALRSQWPASSNRQRILRYYTFHPPHRLSLDAHLQEKRLGPGRIMACKLDAFPSRNAPRLLHAVTREPTSAEHSPTTPRTLCSTAAILGSLPPRVPCSVGFAIFVDD